ncbi:OLC1v1036870C2 [Oldenlandia corymbosa var. corymbosa]|uniref:endo-polygalacturonase n=1 Tax=Oldenlandia corymbosa var. corymbosa TaxID=529605 RepID=A0AAV1CXQ3_OLDCO|nr:OLC1v1036870C2 [Oldenlandia corymbosa var. corymbosa]
MAHHHRSTTIFFPFFVMVVVSSFSFSSCIHHEHMLEDHNRFQEEIGYDFQAYPLYTSQVDIHGRGQLCDMNSTNQIEDERISSFDGLIRQFSDDSARSTIVVDNYGAKGDGSSDDTKAFQDAWNQSCSSTSPVTFVVSRGKQYLLKPITFSGPCNSPLTLQIYGTLKASDNRGDYRVDGRHWILFQRIKNLTVEGGGTINGNGNIWWQNSCKINKTLPCKEAPTAVTFYDCQNIIVENLNIEDAQQMHISFEQCSNVQASNLVVKSPEKSPNTDGIHVANTHNIQISSCTIGTGDDCISISNGSQNVQASDIICGPGHGISIGSLGAKNSEARVSGVFVNGANLSGTTNGIRIKTWQGGSGSASNMKFQNIQMQNVENPIIIDQNYCDQPTPCTHQESAVQVKNVFYQNISGTSASDIAINFDCSKSYPCEGILLQNVDLVKEGGGASNASCNNIHLINVGTVSPRCP